MGNLESGKHDPLLKGSADRIIKNALDDGRTALLEHEAKRICNEYHIDTPKFRLAQNALDAGIAAKRLGFPVVMKIVSPDIIHKTDAGCVLMGLRNGSEVRRAFSRIIANAEQQKPNARILGVLVEEMQPPGIEVIVGGIREPPFGQTLMFGLGGVFVELFEDVSFRVEPLSERAAKRMIREIRGYEVLKGYRGNAPADEESLVRILLSSSKLMQDHPEIFQMDLNPTLVYQRNATAVDARIALVA